MSPALTDRFLPTEPLEKSRGEFESTFERCGRQGVAQGRCVAGRLWALLPLQTASSAWAQPTALPAQRLHRPVHITVIVFFGGMARGILVCQPGLNPCPRQWKRSPSHWAAREFSFPCSVLPGGLQSLNVFQRSFLHTLVHASSRLLIETHRLAPVISGFVSFQVLLPP